MASDRTRGTMGNFLFVGEETRLPPSNVDFSDWISQATLELVGENVRFPASFDRAVWPRPEDVESTRSAVKGRNILELEPIQPCEKVESSRPPRIALALTTFNGVLTQAVREGALKSGVGPRHDLPGWRLLGFDVLDSGLAMSGLLNFGHAVLPIAREVLKMRGEKLNGFLLWPTRESADEYQKRLDSVIGAHAPFEVAGLFTCSSL